MLSDNDFLRFSRQIMLPEVGEQGQAFLQHCSVLIVGMGGLGCPASLYLTTAGIGKLIIVDQDRVETSNLHRQILYTDADCSHPKVEVAQRRLQPYNPSCHIEAHQRRIDSQWLQDNDADLILDCSDNHLCRTTINRHCLKVRRPWISAAVTAWEGYITEFHCHRQLSPCYNCWRDEQEAEAVENCSSLGVIGPLPGLLGAWQALRGIRLLLDRHRGVPSDSQHGQVFLIDSKLNQSLQLQLQASEQCAVCQR